MNSTFADRLISARLRTGFSQSDLGEIADVAQTQISRYESGRATPRRPVIEKLASALGVPPTWLASGAGPDAQFLVRLSGGSGELKPVLVADQETNQEFLQMAANAGVSPDQFLKLLMVEHLQKLADSPLDAPAAVESRLSEMGRKIDRLEEQIAVIASSKNGQAAVSKKNGKSKAAPSPKKPGTH